MRHLKKSIALLVVAMLHLGCRKSDNHQSQVRIDPHLGSEHEVGYAIENSRAKRVVRDSIRHAALYSRADETDFVMDYSYEEGIWTIVREKSGLVFFCDADSCFSHDAGGKLYRDGLRLSNLLTGEIGAIAEKRDLKLENKSEVKILMRRNRSFSVQKTNIDSEMVNGKQVALHAAIHDLVSDGLDVRMREYGN